MNLAKLQKEAHAIAKDHGWWPPNCPQCGDDNTHWTDGFKGDGTQPPEEGYWACHECLEADNSPFIFESGFGFIPRRTFGDCIALVHSELSEALEAYRELGLDDRFRTTFRTGTDGEPKTVVSGANWKPVGVASELADVVIRVADMVEFYGWELVLQPNYRSGYPHSPTFGDWITALHDQLPALDDCKATLKESLERFVSMVQRMAAHYGIDLDAAIAAKMEYNRGRPYRHGGKVL